MSRATSLPSLFGPSPDPVSAEYKAEDPYYRATRDHVTKRPVRAGLTKAWREYGHWLPEKPEHFVQEFRRDFYARSWELYVLRWLARTGAQLVKAPAKGPDFHAEHPRIGPFWVECVVPTAGEGANRVWQRTDETIWGGPPDAPIQLRYTSAIQFKIKKIAAYRATGIVAPSEPVLIAMNQGAILDSDLNDIELPLAFKVLYGVGRFVMRVEIGSGDTEYGVQAQPVIANAKGSPVSTTIFMEATSNVVAGLLLARASTINLFGHRRRRMLLAHNPLAVSQVPVGSLPLRGELWVEDDVLVHRGVVSPYGRYSRPSRRKPT